MENTAIKTLIQELEKLPETETSILLLELAKEVDDDVSSLKKANLSLQLKDVNQGRY